MSNDRILRFHAADKIFHGVNAITWFALLFSGLYVYFMHPAKEAAENAMLAHLILGGIFTFNLLAFVLLSPDRFALIMKACMEWDMNTIKWFRNFGGYPRRFFKIPFGPVEVPLQRWSEDVLSHLHGHDRGFSRYRLDALARCSFNGQNGLHVDVLLPCLGLHHLLLNGRRRSHPVGSPLDGTLQGYLALWPGYDLRTRC